VAQPGNAPWFWLDIPFLHEHFYIFWRHNMKNIWIIIAMEFRLFLRGKVCWLLAAFMVLSSVMLVSGGARWNAYSIWASLAVGYMLLTLVFGAALALLITTFTRGQRVVTSMVLILVWLVPIFGGSGNSLVDALNVSGMFFDATDAAHTLGMTFGGAAAPTPVLAQRVVQLVQSHIPWDYLTSTMWLNRAIFLLGAVFCLLGTLRSLNRQRQGL
jgi:hypothetical protein